MPDAAWGLIGVVVGGILVLVGNYMVHRQARKWRIEDERRRLRQEPLKQAYREVQDVMSSASECLVMDRPMGEIPVGQFAKLFNVLQYLIDKGVMDGSDADMVMALLEVGRQDDPLVFIRGVSMLSARIEEALDATFETKCAD